LGEPHIDKYHTVQESSRANFMVEVNNMKINTYLKIVLQLLSVVLIMLLAACGSTPTETLSSASGSAEFVLRGMNTHFYSGSYDSLIIPTYRLKGAASEGKIPLVITGPASWNDGKPFETTLEVTPETAWFDGDEWVLSFFPDFPTPPGIYKATTEIAGKTYTSTVDVSNFMPLPDVLVNATADKVDVSWQAVPGAKGYYVSLYNQLSQIYYQIFTEQTSVSFEDFESPLDTTQTFSVSVQAYSEKVYDPVVGDIIPVNLMTSYTEVSDIF
jgi:hypothetical protein